MTRPLAELEWRQALADLAGSTGRDVEGERTLAVSPDGRISERWAVWVEGIGTGRGATQCRALAEARRLARRQHAFRTHEAPATAQGG